MVSQKKLAKKLKACSIPTAQSVSDNDHDADTAEARWDQISSLYLNPKYSDMTIVCGGESFPAHRSIICPQSDYFQKCCDGHFQENSKPFDFTGHAPTLIKGMLQFLYTGDYSIATSIDYDEVPPPPPDETGNLEQAHYDASPSHLEAESPEPEVDTITSSGAPFTSHPACFHAQMYAKGLYFLIPGLQAKAKKCFRSSFVDVNSESFAAVIREVYSTEKSARGLRDIVIEIVMENLFSMVWNKPSSG